MRTLVALFIVASLSAACGSSEPQVEVPRYLGEPNGDAAAMTGMLVIENDCLYVRTENGENVLTAFPSAFTQWDNRRKILILGGAEIPLGEAFIFGGSGMDTNRANNVRWSTPPRRACVEGQRYIWLSQEAAIPLSERTDWGQPVQSSSDAPSLSPPTPTIANP